MSGDENRNKYLTSKNNQLSPMSRAGEGMGFPSVGWADWEIKAKISSTAK